MFFFLLTTLHFHIFYLLFSFCRRKENKQEARDVDNGQQYANLCSRCLIEIKSYSTIKNHYSVPMLNLLF